MGGGGWRNLEFNWNLVRLNFSCTNRGENWVCAAMIRDVQTRAYGTPFGCNKNPKLSGAAEQKYDGGVGWSEIICAKHQRAKVKIAWEGV